MKNNKDETFYDVLGLDEKCTPEDIKKAYRKLSFMHHPDKNGNSQESTEKFQKISEAFSILSDPNERVKYDANRNNPFVNIGGNAGMGGGGIRINPMDIFNMFMGGMGGMNGMSGMGGLGGLGGGGMGGPRVIIRTFGPGGASQFEEVVSDGMMGGLGGGDPLSALFNEINRDMRAHMHPHIQQHHQQHRRRQRDQADRHHQVEHHEYVADQAGDDDGERHELGPVVQDQRNEQVVPGDDEDDGDTGENDKNHVKTGECGESESEEEEEEDEEEEKEKDKNWNKNKRSNVYKKEIDVDDI